jgi:F-type H+-transporting ATPase subunit b
MTFSLVSLAEEHAAHGEAHAIPTKLIAYQTLNVVLMIVALVYFLKEPVRKFFLDKRSLFLSAAQKAEAARKAAEDEHAQIKVRLTKLESTADESVVRARAEAADMKKQLIAEAEVLSKRIRQEAEEAARNEVEKAKNQLRESLIRESLEMAKSQLASKVTPEDHKRLQTEFISNIQAVQK